ITPQTIISSVKDTIHQYLKDAGYQFGDEDKQAAEIGEEMPFYGSIVELEKEIGKLEKKMHEAARELAFEEAAHIRDQIKSLRKLEIEIG
ncbi:MAG: UvrB/UvrC motif-containing protein, partial [Deltaproteobacteria bacterium]|nr:UvrB/UvrC motif-containing protein [Deltaproteobacteria bacterium]